MRRERTSVKSMSGCSAIYILLALFGLIYLNNALGTKIIGGDVVTASNLVPYQASLHYKGNAYCGGSIIGPKHILTAAHCINKLQIRRLTVGVGSVYNELSKKYTISENYTHPKYNKDTSDCDIAVLILREPLEFGPNVQPIALPRQNEPVAIALATVSGWGHTLENGRSSPQLREVSVPIIPLKKCRKLFEHANAVVTRNMLCAALITGGRDACQGDSGGPLVYKEKQIGVVSWGIGCGREHMPGVYVRVSKFTDWIESIIN